MLSVSSPLYDITKTFEENFSNPSFLSIKPPTRVWPDKTHWILLLGYLVASKIGAAACSATTAQGIALLAQLGFDIDLQNYTTPSLSCVSFTKYCSC